MQLHGREIAIAGKFLKTASVKSEWYQGVNNIEEIIDDLKQVPADIFSFQQRIPDTQPLYNYSMEWSNVAAIPITTYDHWWTNQVNDKTRNMVRKAGKKGVEIRVSDFDEKFVRGISEIYNETPIRQGRPFWHYGKSFDVIKKENSSFLERSDFIGAWYKGELIGFIKVVYDKNFATIMQIISKIGSRDKSPNNAMVAKAVELCAKKRIPYLVYSAYIYGKKGEDALTRFKRHNAFEKIDLPHYFIPLTLKGRIALKLKIHHGFRELLPERLLRWLLDIRKNYYLKKISGS